MHVGTAQGIPIRLHSTFFLITGFYFLSSLISYGWAAAIESAILILILFGSVFLHEMGHALVARRYGIGTRNITLHLLGGFASIEREPKVPRQEVAIALAGPAVNVILFIMSLPLVLADVPLALEVAAINLLMGVFNLVPAYPMDGGRVLRAILNSRYGYEEATRLSFKVTKVFGWGFVVAGIFYSWIGLIIVGAFLLFITHAQERQRQ
jgi:stage IV sporulation protein FB